MLRDTVSVIMKDCRSVDEGIKMPVSPAQCRRVELAGQAVPLKSTDTETQNININIPSGERRRHLPALLETNRYH